MRASHGSTTHYGRGGVTRVIGRGDGSTRSKDVHAGSIVGERRSTVGTVSGTHSCHLYTQAKQTKHNNNKK